MNGSIPVRMESDCRSSGITEPFLYHLQCALLLALQEKGTLTAMQYRSAMKQLDAQYPGIGGMP